MDNILFASIGFVFLLSIVYFIPLGISIKGKLTLLTASLFVSIIGIISIYVYQWWYILILLITLSGLLTILLSRFIQPSKIIKEEQENNTNTLFLNNVQRDNPDYSLTEEFESTKQRPHSELTMNTNETFISEYEGMKETHDYVHESSEPPVDDKDDIDEVQENVAQPIPTTIKEEEEIFLDREKESEQEGTHVHDEDEHSMDEPIKRVDLSPEEELLAARQQIIEEPMQDKELNLDPLSTRSEPEEDDFILDEFEEDDLEQKDAKKQFDDQNGFESFEVDIIEERDIPSRSSEVLKEDRSEFTDLEDLLNKRNDQHDTKGS